MQKSDSIANLAKALILFHTKVDKIKKNADNPFFKKKYADLSNILEAIQIPMAEAGLSFTQIPVGQCSLVTVLMHGESGEYVMGEYEMRPVKDDPQGRGSTITYQRRYALQAFLGLNIEDDDDGNAGSKTKAPQGNNNPPEQNKGMDNTGPNDLPWLNENTAQFKGAVEKLKAGQTTIAKIKTVMRISKATEEKLIAASKK